MGRAARPHYSTGQRCWVGAVCWFSAAVALIDACPPTLRFRVHQGQKIKGEIKGRKFQIAAEPAHGSEHLFTVAAVVFPSSGHSGDGRREKERGKERVQTEC